jgi:NAD-dependent deacetylase
MRKKIVALTGAGISVESGLPTFRDPGGLWENRRLEEVASPAAWAASAETVLRFYNERRQALRAAQPNAGHRALAELETAHEVVIVTQNIDDLHERAGSSRIIHLHGELMKARSMADASLLFALGERDIALGDRCPLGSQLRPHVVWFGEQVPLLEDAADEIATADILLVIGTSLTVYPAAALIHDARPEARRIFIDPNATASLPGFEILPEPASKALPVLVKALISG